MWSFDNENFNTLINNFVKFMINPTYDAKNIHMYDNKFLEYDSTEISTSKMNIIYSKAINENQDKDEIKEFFDKYNCKNALMTWCTIDLGYRENEIEFFKNIGFHYSDTCVVMELSTKDYKINNISNLNTKINEQEIEIELVDNKNSLNKFVNVIDSAFDESLIDITKYKHIFDYNEKHQISKMIILKCKSIPATTGSVYMDDKIAILDDIATHPDFRNKGLAKVLLHELIMIAKENNYETIMLISTTQGSGVYKSIGFRETDLILNVFTTKKLDH